MWKELVQSWRLRRPGSTIHRRESQRVTPSKLEVLGTRELMMWEGDMRGPSPSSGTEKKGRVPFSSTSCCTGALSGPEDAQPRGVDRS